MRFVRVISLFAICWSCGPNDSASNPTNNAAQQTPDSLSPPATPKKTVYSIAVDVEPACAADNDNQIIYVRPEQTLKACTSGEWVAITIAASAGAKGDRGPQGEVGAQGPKGDPGRIPSPTEWIDQTTSISWLIGADQSSGQMATANVCGGTYRLGTQAEVKSAILNGLGVFVAGHSALTYVWTGEVYMTGQRFAVGFDTVSQFAASGVVACRSN